MHKTNRKSEYNPVLEMRLTPLKKVSVRGEPIPFRAYIPKEEVIQYRKVQI